VDNSIFAELKRRNVFKVASVYLIASWLVLQIITVLTPYLKLPALFGTIVTVVLIVAFPFACIFAWVFELTPEGVKLSKDVQRDESISHETGSKINFILVVSLLLALAYISYEKVFNQPNAETKTLSIAVLPFADMSSDKSQEYFSDGIAEEILNSLASLPQLHVIARTSSFQFKDAKQDIRNIAAALGVNYLLDGSVRKDKSTLRVTAQLIDAVTGSPIWSESYDRKLADIFALQDELTFAITQALKLNLLPEQVKVEQGMTSNQQAYDLFLQGRELSYQRNPQALQRAVSFLEQAIALDPNFALAKAQLYIVYVLSEFYGELAAAIVKPAIKDLFSDLLVSEAVFPLKLTVIANHIERTENKPEKVMALYERAAKQAPSDSIIQNWRLLALVEAGELEAAVQAREAFYKINPLDQVNIYNLIRVLYWLNQPEKAGHYIKIMRETAPMHSLTANIVTMQLLFQQKQPQQALEYLQSFSGELNTYSKSLHIELLLETHQFKKALNTLGRYLGEQGQYHQHYSFSIVNLLAYQSNAAAIADKLQDVQSVLKLSEPDYHYYLQAQQALSGNVQPFVDSMEQRFANAEIFKAIPIEQPFMLLYAMIKYNNGHSQYLARYPYLSKITKVCRKTAGRFNELCTFALAASGETDSELLLTQAINSFGMINPGFIGVERYALTGPHFYMLHGYAEFQRQAKDYLINTYPNWSKVAAIGP
jgi:TolB-like protein